MSDFDQTARALVELEPQPFLGWLGLRAGLDLSYRDFYPERTLPRLTSPERIADQVAILAEQSPSTSLWLFVLEWQTEPQPEKLDVLLEEAAILRSRARWGPDRARLYSVLPILLHLTGRTPETERNMRTPLGFGTHHRPLLWDVATENAGQMLESVAGNTAPWVLLFWLPLMSGAEQEIIATRWLEVVQAQMPAARHGDAFEAALTFAELAQNYALWERTLRRSEMGESQYLNGVRERSRRLGELNDRRRATLELLEIRFPGEASAELVQLIEQQESLDLLRDWFRALARAETYDEFLAVLRR